MLRLIQIVFLATHLHAIEHLPCQRALGSDLRVPGRETVRLLSNQIAVRGLMHAFWETGSEAHTGWSILDAQILDSVSDNAFDALFHLSENDRVYVLHEEQDAIEFSGFHSERLVTRTITIRGREFQSRPNVPRLLVSRDGERRVIEDDVYADLFHHERPALAILNLSADNLAYYNTNLAPKLAAARLHAQDPSRFVDVGSEKSHERKVFETKLEGRPETRDDGRVRIVGAEGPEPLRPHDLVYLLDQSKNAVGLVRIMNYPAQVDLLDLGLFRRAKHAIVFRKNGSTNWMEHDF